MKIIITEEQSEKLNHKVKSMIKKYGLKETLKLFDNNKDIIRRTYQDNPLEFLNNFNNLTPVEIGSMIFYVDKDRLPLFMHYQDIKDRYIYINYNRIWSFFLDVIGLNDKKIQNIIKTWLEETYNLSGLTLVPVDEFIINRWKILIN
jgi:hypothetical protein